MGNAAADQAVDAQRNVSAPQALVNSHFDSIQMARDQEFAKSALYPDPSNNIFQSQQARQVQRANDMLHDSQFADRANSVKPEQAAAIQGTKGPIQTYEIRTDAVQPPQGPPPRQSFGLNLDPLASRGQ